MKAWIKISGIDEVKTEGELAKEVISNLPKEKRESYLNLRQLSRKIL
jgi:hypothetical protein